MGFEINKLVKASEGEGSLVASERLCLTEDGRVVLESDADARWLWKIPGNPISAEEAAQYGLTAESTVVDSSAEGGAEAKPPKPPKKADERRRRKAAAAAVDAELHEDQGDGDEKVGIEVALGAEAELNSDEE